jgi:hypothetical protein
VNARLNVLVLAEIALIISPYKIFFNDSNGHGCYFKKWYYSNIWIIHVQSLTNLFKSMWKPIFTVIDVFLKFGSPKRKTHKVQMNNDPCKAFKKYVSKTRKLKNKQKFQFIWTYENMVKF